MHEKIQIQKLCEQLIIIYLQNERTEMRSWAANLQTLEVAKSQ
ncbi:hypothetical protein pb186bvf_021201 [Paramecium bursaria]